MNPEDQQSQPQGECEELQARLRTMLPAEYRDRAEDVLPVSMSSAGLKYDPEGRVAWGEIWQSFCDLAMAGGPPHRGTLLQPASPEEIAAAPLAYDTVVRELCRGLSLVTGLFAAPAPAPTPGWVRVDCTSAAMAGWLARALVMENVSARSHGLKLYLPAGPAYRVPKEIKNVVTAAAKTCHYWTGHFSAEQRDEIAALLRVMQAESPLLEPPLNASGEPGKTQAVLCERIRESTGLHVSPQPRVAWLGVECNAVPHAITMMRVLAVSNVFSHREGTVLFAPLNPQTDPHGDILVRMVARAHRFALAKNISQAIEPSEALSG